MKDKLVYSIVISLIIATSMMFLKSNDDNTVFLRTYSFSDDECTKEMQAACAVDLERTAKNCAKVFATDGASIISDIKCYRDIQNDRKKCWPCLC